MHTAAALALQLSGVRRRSRLPYVIVRLSVRGFAMPTIIFIRKLSFYGRWLFSVKTAVMVVEMTFRWMSFV